MAGVTSTKKIKGQPHLLAYITPNEVEKLKALGGQETMTKEGIPAYPEFDNYTEVGGGTKSQFEGGGGYEGVGSSNDGVIQQYDNQFKELKKKEKALADIKAGFVGQSKVKPGFFEIGGKKDRYNKKQRQKFINYLIKEKQKNLQKGLMDSSIPGIDTMTMEELIGFAPTVQDYVDKGFYKKDGAFAKGKVPSYNISPDMPGLLSIVQDKFSGPVTQEKLMEYYKNINTLENLDPTDSNNSIKNLMETYQPNRYNLLYPTGGNDQPQVYLPQVLPTDDQDDSTEDNEFEYRFGDNEFGAADVTRGSYIFNQGGRVPRNMGGIMNAVPRQGYFLGKIVKGVGKAIGSVADAAGKVLKSDFGKMALAGAAFYYGGGGGMPKFLGGSGLGGFKASTFFSKANPLLFTNNKLSLGKLGLASAALPYFMGDPKPNEDIGMTDRGGSLIDPLTGEEATPAEMRANINSAVEEAAGDPIKLAAIDQKYNNMLNLVPNTPYPNYGLYANGGRIARAEGGLMNLGGMEKDYRAEGGFVPIGKAEKADDVPARLSVNEFVFTADAVRNAGGGDIDKGAEVMENMMKNLENGGTVSEESQGNTGAQEMFSVSERIGEVI